MGQVVIDIRGKKFPLCLTVAAVDKINAMCGGLKNLNDFLAGRSSGGAEADSSAALHNTLRVLELFVAEGEENRLCEARFSGESAARRDLPSAEDLASLLTPGEVMVYRVDVMKAINASLKQEIRAVPEKNGEHAELE